MDEPTLRSFRPDDAIPELTVDASITSRPFFESGGFVSLAEQQVAFRGVTLTNDAMRRAVD